MQESCAICQNLRKPPSPTKTVLGLRTALPELLARAITDFGTRGGLCHVLLPVCPEHAVDVYRGRVAGVEMAWRMPQDTEAVAAAR